MDPLIDQAVREHRPAPLAAQLVAATGDLSWAPAVALGVTLPALLLPNGHLRSRRWRLVVITSVTGLVLIMVAGPLAPGPLEEMGGSTTRSGSPARPATSPRRSRSSAWCCTG